MFKTKLKFSCIFPMLVRIKIRAAPWIKGNQRKKPILKYLITYNVYSNTANSHFILKYTSLDIMQQQQVPLQKVTK